MRDIFVLLVVLGCLPATLFQPYIGVLVWSWLGYMNPHRISWGFATDFPFAMLVAMATVVAMAFSQERKHIPWTRETVILLLFILWMVLTTAFAVHLQLALPQLEKVLKIQFMTFVTLMLMTSRERLNLLVWIIVLSLGFYGLKGGVFTIMTGGGYHVMGPPGTFIGGNNEIGLALIMTIPLMRYLQLQTQSLWIRWGFWGAMFLSFIAVLGTQSRGAFLGVAAMAMFLIMKSRRRAILLLMMLVAIAIGLYMMPEAWYERMASIKYYQEDSSAMGRLRAWRYAIDTALARPLLGGGYGVFAGRTDAHSIYFEILGEHGFIGLGLFLLLGLMTWRSGSWIRKKARDIADLKWASDLAAMLQVSLVGYAVSGAFLGLGYFDLYYHLVAIMVLTRVIVARHDEVVMAAITPLGSPAFGPLKQAT